MWKLTLGCIEQWGWSSCMRVLKGMSSFAPLENMDFVCLLKLFWKERQIHTTGFQLLKLWQPIIGFCNSATQSVFITAIWVQFEWWETCLQDLVDQFSLAVALLQCTKPSKGFSWSHYPLYFCCIWAACHLWSWTRMQSVLHTYSDVQW
jgi:hypothetical protein